MIPVVQLLTLLFVANGAPILIDRVLHRRLDFPIDFGLRLPDGYPVLGRAKTLRGLLVAVVTTAITARLLGYSFGLGAAVGGLAMAGDLLSSFVKRRMGLESSSMAPGIDQVPESLIPAAAVGPSMGLSGWQIAITVALFVALEIPVSRLLHRIGIRRKPY